MTVGGKSSNNLSEEEVGLENLGVKRKDDEKKAGGQADDKLECSLCQVGFSKIFDWMIPDSPTQLVVNE